MTTPKRPSKPWRVIWTTGSGPHTITHRSERATYDEINAERKRHADGLSRVTQVRVEKWEHGQWIWFEQLSLNDPTP